MCMLHRETTSDEMRSHVTADRKSVDGQDVRTVGVAGGRDGKVEHGEGIDPTGHDTFTHPRDVIIPGSNAVFYKTWHISGLQVPLSRLHRLT